MTDHVALITGGAQNIGEAIARTFASAGAKVMIADLNGDKAAATGAKIAAETGQQVLGIQCDVTDEAQIKACPLTAGGVILIAVGAFLLLVPGGCALFGFFGALMTLTEKSSNSSAVAAVIAAFS